MKFDVHGQLSIPFSICVNSDTKNDALIKIQNLMTMIMKFDGDLFLNDGRKLPIIADKVTVEYLEALGEDDL